MATVGQVTKLLIGLSCAYAHAPELSAANFHTYARLLADVPYDLLAAAVDQVASESKFFPSAGELRQAALQLQEWAEPLPSAYEAWGEIAHSFGAHGLYHGAPDWSHPFIGKVLKLIGGYNNLCRSENPVADRSQFISAYKEQLERHRIKTRMLPHVRDSLYRLGSGDAGPEHLGNIDVPEKTKILAQGRKEKPDAP